MDDFQLPGDKSDAKLLRKSLVFSFLALPESLGELHSSCCIGNQSNPGVILVHKSAKSA